MRPAVESERPNEPVAPAAAPPGADPGPKPTEAPAPPSQAGASVPAAAKRPRKWRRRLLWASGAALVGAVGLWIAIHRIPWLGPWLAEGARSVLGPAAVAWLEDTAYGVEDRVNRWRYGEAPPKVLWEEEAAPPEVAPRPATSASASGPPPAFPPPNFAPPFPQVAAAGDGVWLTLDDGRAKERDGRPGAFVRALVHPDPKRSFAAVAVVAMDLTRLDLRLVAGVSEPQSHTVPRSSRPGMIPKEHVPALVAAFNGGFRAVHGQYGMRLGSDLFLPPRDMACTVALLPSAPKPVRIGTWSAIKADDATFEGFRQTPPCLVEGGKKNPVINEYSRGWGATVSGDTIIRRSALGIDPTGQVLYYALGDALSVDALAMAMKAIGSVDAAQLDVNYSYPRFILYADGATPEAPPEASKSIIRDVKFRRGEYAVEPAERDFFYIMRKPPSAPPAPAPASEPPPAGGSAGSPVAPPAGSPAPPAASPPSPAPPTPSR